MTNTSTPLYYVPKTGMLKLSSGDSVVVVAGVRALDDVVVGDVAATRYGIKPEHEMTADERAALKLAPPLPDVSEAAPDAEAKPEPVLDVAADRPRDAVPYAPPGAAGVAAPVSKDVDAAAGSKTATPSTSAAAKPTVAPATGT